MTTTDPKAREARYALRAMTAVRAHQRYARLTGGEGARHLGAAIRDLVAGLEHLCAQEGLSLAALMPRDGVPRSGGTLADAPDAELAGTIRAVRDAYVKRLPARDQRLWIMECDELASWIGEGS